MIDTMKQKPRVPANQADIVDAREQRRDETRARLLLAARNIAAEEGWQALTIRRLADEIEYTSPILYQYFENKNALLQELLREGFRLLLEDLEMLRKSDEGLEGLALVYWKFALANPELYQAMHGLGGVPFGTADAPIEAQKCFFLVRGALEDHARANGQSLPSPDDAVDTIWALLHGFVSLAMTKRLAGGQRRHKRLMLDATISLVASLSARDS